MAFCLPPNLANKFKTALVDGTINPDQLTAMTSAERREFFGKIVGEDNAKDVNALLESKLLLKDQNAGLVTWAKQTAGITEPQRRDLISRIEKLDRVLNPTEERAFLADLAAQKIGATVTLDEAKIISEGAKKVTALKEGIDRASEDGSKSRLAYGLAARQYHNYMNHLLGKDSETIAELLKSKNPAKIFLSAAGFSKAINAAFDLSYLLRQGYKTLATNPDIWAKDTVKMFKDVAKELKGIDAMDLVHADIMSRENALNGKFKAGDYNLGLDFEETFPSALPGELPVLGRLYKASETAFNGTALRMRADLADRFIEKAEQFGLDTLNPAQAQPVGDLVNAMTGRGRIPGLTPGTSNLLNVAFFSVRFLKSNYDTLTGHTFGAFIKDPLARKFVRIEAAKNIAKLIGFAGSIMVLANFLHPGSAELDPRSSNFGKIKLGQTTFDISGGMAPLITLAARVIMRETKSSTTGQISELNTGQFGAKTMLDYVNSFFEGRASPFGQALLNYLRGENYQGQKPTLLNTAAGLVTPMPLQTAMQARNEPQATIGLGAALADFLGVNANPPNPVDAALSARDPTELELVRLGFNSKNVQPQSGDTHIDSLIEEHLHPLLEDRLKTYMAAPFYQKLTDARKALYLKGLIEGTIRYAKSLAARDPDNRKDFQEFRKQNIPARKAAVINEMNQGAQP